MEIYCQIVERVERGQRDSRIEEAKETSYGVFSIGYGCDSLW